MKKILKWTGILAGGALFAVAVVAAYVAVMPPPHYDVERVTFAVDGTPDRVARGRRHVEMLCAGCHLDPQTGALTGKHMLDVPPKFGQAWSLNITAHPTKGIGGWTDGDIAYLLRTGVTKDGRYTPPWMVKLPHLSDEELKDIIAFLRSDDPLVRPRDVDNHPSSPSFLTKVLLRVAFKPLPYPTQAIVAPAETDTIAFGRYLVTARYQCYGCHSSDFRTVDMLVPEKSEGYFGGGNPMPDAGGKTVWSANLTPHDETGLGTWTEAQFKRALVDGIRPDNRPLRYPMLPFRGLYDREVSAMFAYLRTLRPMHQHVPRPQAYAIDSADEGKRIYYRYACNTCHGETGEGLYDLRKGARDYPTDEALIAYIKHPEKDKPATAMPTWDGVIADAEYPVLAAYVRRLGEATPR